MIANGNILLIIGIAGLVFFSILGLVFAVVFHRKKKKLKAEIYKEYE